MRPAQHPGGLLLAALLALSGCATGPAALRGPAASAEAAPQPTACPAALPPGATCLSGQDTKGAYYLIAKPADWNGVLVLHAHGGPLLSAPSPRRAVEDLERWAVMVKAGHAWAGSTFHQGGVAVRAAAEDTERLRGIFLRHVGQPTRVIKIPENSIQSHINWGTLHFQDITSKRTGGRSPFGNEGAVYAGSEDDAALNTWVRRYLADPAAYRDFAEDTDPGGTIPVPVLSTKWIDDPTAFVELDARFRGIMDRGGSGARLVQTFTTRGTHSYISDPTYAVLMDALLRWVDQGAKPTPAGIAADCPGFEARFGKGCSFAPGYQPAPLETRVPWRLRPE